MADLRVEGNDLVVRMNPLERLATFRWKPRVALDTVLGMEIVEHPRRDLLGLRVLGTGIPAVVEYGTYEVNGGLTFAAVNFTHRRAVRVRLDSPSGRFQQFVIGRYHPDATLQALSALVAKSNGPTSNQTHSFGSRSTVHARRKHRR